MKIIDKRKAQLDPYVAKSFRREAKLLQMVHHPNIVQLYEVIETNENLYLIMELCSGIHKANINRIPVYNINQEL